jgi:hypothetical protein
LTLVGFAAALVVGAFAWAGLGGKAGAQETDDAGPLRLLPSETDSLPEPSAGNIEDASDSGLRPDEDVGLLIDPVIEIGRLSEIDPNSLGLLDEQSGGLPDSLWQGSSLSTVDKLLTRMPLNANSPAMRDLTLKLLLASGQAPRGSVERGDFLHRRAMLLVAMGEYSAGIALLESARLAADEEKLPRLRNGQYLKNLELDAACAQAGEEIRRSAAAYWQQVIIFCQARDGLGEAALLGLDLMREGGDAPEAGFEAMIRALAVGGQPEIVSLPEPTPLDAVLLHETQAPVPSSVVETANPALLRVIARAPGAAPEIRLAAAERAASLGALAPADLERHYAAVEFTPEERSSPFTVAEAMAGPLARALLYQAISAESVASARAEVLSAALELADSAGKLPIMARASLENLRLVPAQPGFAWFAHSASRSLIAAGAFEEGWVWYDLALDQAAFDADAADAATRLWPIAAISGAAAGFDQRQFAAWWEREADGGANPIAFGRAALLLDLLDALGHDVPIEVWHVLLTGPSSQPARVSSTALAHVLRDASAGGRIGETALAALLSLGEGGTAQAGLPVIGDVLRALQHVGLEQEARTLAVETALAAGF